MVTLLKVPPHIILRDEPQFHGSYIAFNHKTCETFSLSQHEFALLASIGETPRFYHSNGSASVTPELRDALRCLQDRGLIKVCQRQGTQHTPLASQPAHVPPPVPAATLPVLSFPTRVDITLTHRCNMRCVHCNVEAFRPMPHELQLHEWIDVFDQLEANRVFKIQISGGEATAYPQFSKLVDHLATKEYAKSVLTNGAFLKAPLVHQLSANRITVQVSLDGGSPATHDAFRRSPGSFKRIMAALEDFQKEENITSISTTIHTQNKNELRAIFDICQRFGVATVQFGFIDEVGRGASAAEWEITLAEIERVREEFYLVKEEYPNISAFIEDPRSLMEGGENLCKELQCKAGTYSMAIDADGMVYPCTLGIQLRALPIGNVREQSLKDIWFSEKWNSFRGDITLGDLTVCGPCPHNRQCTMKKCRMRSIQETGDIYDRPYKCPGKEIEAIEALVEA